MYIFPEKNSAMDAEVCLLSSIGWAIEGDGATSRTLAIDVRLRKHSGPRQWVQKKGRWHEDVGHWDMMYTPEN